MHAREVPLGQAGEVTERGATLLAVGDAQREELPDAKATPAAPSNAQQGSCFMTEAMPMRASDTELPHAGAREVHDMSTKCSRTPRSS